MTPPYLVSNKNANGETTYRYLPPHDAAKEGIVSSKSFGVDFSAACAYAEEQNAIVFEWRRERKYLKNLSSKSRIEDLIKSYLSSVHYNSLSENTKASYKNYLSYWYKHRLAGVPLPKAKIGNILSPMCQRVYDDSADVSIYMANSTLAVYRLLFNYAIRKGFTTFNPFTTVKKRVKKSRKVVWQREHVRAFLNTAFSNFEWRNIGIIVNMAYEWGQRLGDMRTLTWDDYDVNTGILTLTQSKRGATVQLPTSEGLQRMLKQQHDDFGWQPYIAPSPKRLHGKYKPYTITHLNRTGRKVMTEAKLPEELMLMDLRRTAITEMVEVGVPMSSIMAMSGHSTPMSLAPYIKHTLRGATNAQQMREYPSELIGNE